MMTLQALEDRDNSSKGKSDKKDRSKSPTKGAKSAAGKGKAPPETTIAKAGSKLRKRGEEDLEAKYISKDLVNFSQPCNVMWGDT